MYISWVVMKKKIVYFIKLYPLSLRVIFIYYKVHSSTSLFSFSGCFTIYKISLEKGRGRKGVLDLF